MIFNVASEGLEGVGPRPVFFCSFLKPLNSFFAMRCKFFHLSFTSWVVLRVTPTVFTAVAISSQTLFFFVFVTLLVDIYFVGSQCFRHIFQSVISDAEKIDLPAFFSEAILNNHVTSDFVTLYKAQLIINAHHHLFDI